ncbi:MAG: TerB family tellurite resistance protein [Labilithrix sp.]|nr:TerB family tellurite resistance protein [Labilithrix sp.]
MPFVENVADAVPADVPLTDRERGAVLEIACLAVAADRRIHEHEVAAFRSIANKLGSSADVDAILARFEGGVDRADADARLHELAGYLTTPAARGVAYKTAYALALADLASSDEEFEFDLQLIDALGLSQGEVDRMTEQVNAAIQR